MAAGKNKRAARPKKDKEGNRGPIGYKDDLWHTTAKLRANMDAAGCNHVAPGLILSKFITDTVEKDHARLNAEQARAYGHASKTTTCYGHRAERGDARTSCPRMTC